MRGGDAMRIITLLLALFLAACGGDRVGSIQPVKAVCSNYKDCWAYGETPEGCCVDPHNPYAWICVDIQTDKTHCGDCETSCPGICCRGLCSDGKCQ